MAWIEEQDDLCFGLPRAVMYSLRTMDGKLEMEPRAASSVGYYPMQLIDLWWNEQQYFMVWSDNSFAVERDQSGGGECGIIHSSAWQGIYWMSFDRTGEPVVPKTPLLPAARAARVIDSYRSGSTLGLLWTDWRDDPGCRGEDVVNPLEKDCTYCCFPGVHFTTCDFETRSCKRDHRLTSVGFTSLLSPRMWPVDGSFVFVWSEVDRDGITTECLEEAPGCSENLMVAVLDGISDSLVGRKCILEGHLGDHFSLLHEGNVYVACNPSSSTDTWKVVRITPGGAIDDVPPPLDIDIMRESSSASRPDLWLYDWNPVPPVCVDTADGRACLVADDLTSGISERPLEPFYDLHLEVP